MANTAYLRYTVEPWVRTRLEERYAVPFSSVVLRLHPGGNHEFDAVAENRSVVASIKSASGLTATGRNPSGKIKDSLAELYYLSLVDAPVRILILTNPAFHRIFMKSTRGVVADGLAVECLPLPDDMQAIVDQVVQAASREVSHQIAEVAAATELEAEA